MQEQLRRRVVELVSVHGFRESDLVSNRLQVGEIVREPGSGLAILFEFSCGPSIFGTPWMDEAFTFQETPPGSLYRGTFQFRLCNQTVRAEMARPPCGCRDHPLGFRGKLWIPLPVSDPEAPCTSPVLDEPQEPSSEPRPNAPSPKPADCKKCRRVCLCSSACCSSLVAFPFLGTQG